VAEAVLAGSVKPTLGGSPRRERLADSADFRPPRGRINYYMSIGPGCSRRIGVPPEIIARLADALTGRSISAVRETLAKVVGATPGQGRAPPAASTASCDPRSRAGRRSSPRPERIIDG